MGSFAKEKGIPYLGSLIPISRDALKFFVRLLVERGDRVMLRVLGRRVALLGNPQDIEEVLVKKRNLYGRSSEVRALKPLFGEGLLASEGEPWQRHRTMLQPSFRQSSIRTRVAAMLDAGDCLVNSWHDGDVRNIQSDMMHYTRDVICEALFGDTMPNPSALGQAVDIVFGDLRSEVLYLNLWRRLPFKRSREWNKAAAILNGAIRESITRRRQDEKQHSDLLGALLQATDENGSLNDQEIHDEVLAFFLAGHETTALALTWACSLLAAHPAAQDRVAAEVEDISKGERLTVDHLTKLAWTHAVVKESLRLYPPVWSLGRKVLKDTMLADQPLRRGTDVWICLYRVHRDPRWFTSPHAFLPERWLNQQGPKPFTYLPFGAGPRTCIGQHFAMTEAVAALALIVSRFRLTSLSDAPMQANAWITLRPRSPVLLRATRRTLPV